MYLLNNIETDIKERAYYWGRKDCAVYTRFWCTHKFNFEFVLAMSISLNAWISTLKLSRTSLASRIQLLHSFIAIDLEFSLRWDGCAASPYSTWNREHNANWYVRKVFCLRHVVQSIWFKQVVISATTPHLIWGKTMVLFRSEENKKVGTLNFRARKYRARKIIGHVKF